MTANEMDRRVTKLEDSHDSMRVTLTELVIEFKSTRRAVVMIVAIVGLMQPFMFHYLGKS